VLSRRVGIALPKGTLLPASRPVPSGAPIGKALDWHETHIWIDPEEDFYNQFRGVVAEVRARRPHSTALELPEFIGWAIANNHAAAERLYFWTPFNVLRYLLSDDFAAARGGATFGSAVWGWESGVQALLQRLHERVVMGSADDPVTLRVGSALCAAAHAQLQEIGLVVPCPDTASFERCQRFLVDCASPHTIGRQPPEAP
jgi:hypothetical protein